MSRSRKKYHESQAIKGNDRPFKIEGRRSLRAANRRVLKDLIAHKDIDAVSDEVYNVHRVGAMDPWSWPSDASSHCYYGTEEQYLKECENDWNRSPRCRSGYKNKAEYMAVMKKHYRQGVNK